MENTNRIEQIRREALRNAGLNPDEPQPPAADHIELRPHSGDLHEDEIAMLEAGGVIPSE